jgi:hypothetical protein
MPSTEVKSMPKKRITIDVEEELLSSLDASCAELKTSRNQLIVDSVQRRLRDIEHERVDAAFEKMGKDTAYQAELLQMETDMAATSDTTWKWLDAAERCSVLSGQPKGGAQRETRGRSLVRA